MSRPSDGHFDLVDEGAYQRAAQALEAIEAAGIDYVPGGGWAVFAHQPSVPSIDIDIYLRSGQAGAVMDTLEGTGLNVGKGGEVELLSLEGEIELWGIGDPDLGIPEPSYIPEEIFRDELERKALALPGASLQVRVPARGPLLVTKVVAMANRDLAHQAFFDGAAGMRLGPTLMGHVRSKARAYWERKAGKDLFDIALLLGGDDAGAVATELLDASQLLDDIQDRAADLSEDTLRLARDLADRQDGPDPQEALQAWLDG